MSSLSMSHADVKVHLSALLLQVLRNLQLSQRALSQNFPALSDSTLRNALLSSTGFVFFTACEDDLIVLRQMNHVTAMLQRAVDTIPARARTNAALLEAAISIFDAEAVISGVAPSEKFTHLLEGISSMYLSPEVLS